MNLDNIIKSMKLRLDDVAKDVLPVICESVKEKITEKYKSAGTLINPENSKKIDSIDANKICEKLEIKISDDKANIYIIPNTEHDKAARMHELFGTAPWHRVITEMQNPDSLNRILNSNNIKGAKAK